MILSLGERNESNLHRSIGLTSLILYGIGNILGAGIYGLVGRAAGEMGNTIWIAFLVSMLAAAFTGCSYASLGSRYPRAAGAAYVVNRAFNKSILGYVIGLAVLASGLTSMATSARIFSGYFTGFFHMIPLQWVVACFVCLIALVVFWGIRQSLWMNALCTIVEVLGLLIVIFVGMKFLGRADYLDARTLANPTGEIGIPLLMTGAVLTFYSFIGFEDISNIAEEVKNPQRNLPLGILCAIGASSVIYMLISLVAVSVIPSDELAKSKQPLVDVVAVAAPWFPSVLFSVIAMFAVANTALLNFVMGSRLTYGMAQQGLLPEVLGRVHGNRKTPHISILFILIILLVLSLAGDISVLARATSFLLLLCFMIVNVSLVILKLRANEHQGRFEVPLFVPIVGAMICASMLSFAKVQEVRLAVTFLVTIYVSGRFYKRKLLLPKS